MSDRQPAESRRKMLQQQKVLSECGTVTTYDESDKALNESKHCFPNGKISIVPTSSKLQRTSPTLSAKHTRYNPLSSNSDGGEILQYLIRLQVALFCWMLELFSKYTLAAQVKSMWWKTNTDEVIDATHTTGALMRTQVMSENDLACDYVTRL